MTRRVVLWMCGACALALIASTALLLTGGRPARLVADSLLILTGVTLLTALLGHNFYRSRNR
jgi:hypothetical protein